MSDNIRRMILLGFKADAPQDEVAQLLTELRQGLEKAKGVHNVMVGTHTSVEGVLKEEMGAFTYAVSMDFENDEARKSWSEGELHRSLQDRFIHLIERTQIAEVRVI